MDGADVTFTVGTADGTMLGNVVGCDEGSEVGNVVVTEIVGGAVRRASEGVDVGCDTIDGSGLRTHPHPPDGGHVWAIMRSDNCSTQIKRITRAAMLKMIQENACTYIT